MSKYILSFDQGTTSSRAILFDHAGQIHGIAQKEFTQHFPQPGWVEHDAMEIWSTQIGVASEAISHQNLALTDIAAIGITNQRETTVVWNKKTGLPIYNAIVWQDRRTADYCDTLKAQGKGAMIQEKTGLVIDAYFSGSKLKWILDHVEGARDLASKGELCFGTIDTWLVWKLTNGKVHVTDATNASRTMLFNIHTLQWDTELLSLFDIPASVLPEVKSSSEIYGHTNQLFTNHEIPIAGIAGDQQAALFGQMCTAPGMVKNTYGTGCFMLMHTGEKAVSSKNNLLTTIALQINGHTYYALEGSVFIGGAVVQWLRDGLHLIRKSSEVEDLAKQVEHTDGVYLVPAFAGLGAPYWNQHARGTIVGITRGTSAAHIARAALESIAFQSYDLLKAMEADAGIPIAELRVDGGATHNNMLMQFQSDIVDTKVVRPTMVETTALGAAYLAGLAVGFWKDLEALNSKWQVDKIFTPTIESEQRSAHIQGWARAINATNNW
ncbi:MAG: glycerol kinase GlpK [Bacteroidota bacterium]